MSRAYGVKNRVKFHWFWHVVVPAFVLSLFMIMAALIVFDSNQRDVESTRANQLQNSLNNLRARADQDVKFFELVRQLIITKDAAEHQALINQLKNFKFSETTTTTTSPSTTPTTIPKSRESSAPPPRSTTTIPTARPPPTSTSTTMRPPTSTTTTQPLVCLNLPFTKKPICT